jgi:hypothetical protein
VCEVQKKCYQKRCPASLQLSHHFGKMRLFRSEKQKPKMKIIITLFLLLALSFSSAFPTPPLHSDKRLKLKAGTSVPTEQSLLQTSDCSSHSSSGNSGDSSPLNAPQFHAHGIPKKPEPRLHLLSNAMEEAAKEVADWEIELGIVE